MNYPAFGRVPIVVAASAPKSTTATVVKIILISIFVIVVGIVILGIGLGVGLGVGLTRSSGSSSSTSSLTAPTVNCTYNVSSCGCAAIKPSFRSSRIVQGTTAVANSWPWMVAIYLNNGRSFCGGFLISSQYVLTAAHCVQNMVASSILVYAGLQRLSERTSAQSRTVANYTIHPSYSSSTYLNDIAVIALSSPFTLSTSIGVCCLTSNTGLPSTGEIGVIIGWGLTSYTATTQSNELLQGVIQVKSNTGYCSSTNSNLQFCASYGGTDTCSGDSGGPFMSAVNNAWTCTGIVSSGFECSLAGFYTRVSAYRDFIRSYSGV